MEQSISRQIRSLGTEYAENASSLEAGINASFSMYAYSKVQVRYATTTEECAIDSRANFSKILETGRTPTLLLAL